MVRFHSLFFWHIVFTLSSLCSMVTNFGEEHIIIEDLWVATARLYINIGKRNDGDWWYFFIIILLLVAYKDRKRNGDRWYFIFIIILLLRDYKNLWFILVTTLQDDKLTFNIINSIIVTNISLSILFYIDFITTR